MYKTYTSRPFRIVHVDDEEFPLSFFKNTVEHHKAFEAVSVQSFLNRDVAAQEVIKTPPDLLVTELRNVNVTGQKDNYGYGMSGFELLKILSEQSFKSPVLIFSGILPMQGVEDEARRCAGNNLDISFLKKPATIEEIVTAVGKALGIKCDVANPSPKNLTIGQQGVLDAAIAKAGTPSAALQLEIDKIRAAKNKDELVKIYLRHENIERPKADAELIGLMILSKLAELDPTLNVEALNKEVETKNKDYREARYWREAAEQGDAEAQYHLGNSYENGFDVTKDVAEAVKWYRKAAEHGYADAQSYLGFIYQFGVGVAEDVDEARKWYQKAADQGDEGSIEQLEKIKRRDEQSKQRQPSPIATAAGQYHSIQKKNFVTFKRCLISGIAACFICYIGRNIADNNSLFITVPLTGLPWLIFKISDNEETGEHMDVAQAIGALLLGALLSLLSALPVILAFAFLRNVFAD